MITPERWRTIDAVLQEALARTGAARDRYLDEACRGDPALRLEVESLLSGEAASDGFLERPASLPSVPSHRTTHGAPEASLAAAVGDRYVLERELGRGGMATVWLARDLRHRRHVAIKALRPELAAQIGAARFLREIDVAARLSHPHILPLFDSGATTDALYYVMPYVSGGSLRDWMRRDGRLAEGEVVRILREIALALSHAHRQGIVHRDVKPENVLLNEERHALVADFGIARALDVSAGAHWRESTPHEGEAITEGGMLVGTPAYMSPEQCAGDPAIDHRADLYALGVMAFELLAGEHPFGRRAPSAMLGAHMYESAPPLESQCPHVVPALASLVRQLMTRAKDDRPASAADVARALDEIVAGSTSRVITMAMAMPPDSRPLTEAPAVVPAAPPRASGVRRWGLIGALALVLALGGWWVARSTRAPAPAAESTPVLVVFPFENLGAPDDAYFADGLTDEVTSRLTLVSGLRVIGRSSARRYQGTTRDLREVARELGATHVLTGTVQWSRSPDLGGRVRVRPELVRADDRATIWSESIEGPLEDVFRLQGSLAERVVTSLDVALGAGERQGVSKAPTSNLAAYDAYLRAMTALSRATRQSSRAARESAVAELERAVRLDPGFVAAQARLGDAYVTSYFITGAPPMLERARENTERAWRLDSTNVETLMARAAYLSVSGDNPRALIVARRAADVAPGNPEPWFRLAMVHEALGQVDEAIRAAQRAAALDPRSPEGPATIAGLYHMVRRYDEAVRWRERELVLSPDNMFAYLMQVICHLGWRADVEAARRVAERGGAPFAAWLVRLPNEGGMLGTWQRMLGEETLRARDTLSLAGFLAGGAGFPQELYYRMKLRHFTLRGDVARSRAYADTIVRRLGRPSAGAPDQLLFASATRRSIVAEALAILGRGDEAEREIAASIADSRRQGSIDQLSSTLLQAARIDVLGGRFDRAEERLREVMALPSGEWISATVLRTDEIWAPLRGRPRFEALTTGG